MVLPARPSFVAAMNRRDQSQRQFFKVEGIDFEPPRTPILSIGAETKRMYGVSAWQRQQIAEAYNQLQATLSVARGFVVGEAVHSPASRSEPIIHRCQKLLGRAKKKAMRFDYIESLAYLTTQGFGDEINEVLQLLKDQVANSARDVLRSQLYAAVDDLRQAYLGATVQGSELLCLEVG